MADRLFAGTPLTGEEVIFLADCQQKDAPFKHLDLSYWAQIEHPIMPESFGL